MSDIQPVSILFLRVSGRKIRQFESALNNCGEVTKSEQTLFFRACLNLRTRKETTDGLFSCKHFVTLSKANACLFLYKRKHSTTDGIQNLNRLLTVIKKNWGSKIIMVDVERADVSKILEWWLSLFFL